MGFKKSTLFLLVVDAEFTKHEGQNNQYLIRVEAAPHIAGCGAT